MSHDTPKHGPLVPPESPPQIEGEGALDSRTLFTAGRNEIAIRHNGRTYRLRCTRLGKLILTA